MLKNVLPESYAPYGLVKYKSRWYITVNGRGSEVNVYRNKSEALFVVEKLLESYRKSNPV